MSTTVAKIENLRDLVPLLQRDPGFAQVLQALRDGQSAAIDGAWGSSCALSIASLVEAGAAPLVVVLPRIAELDAFAADVAAFVDAMPVVFPAWESLPREHELSDPVFGGRLRLLQLLDESPPPVVVTSITALLQAVPARAERQVACRTIRVGDEVDRDELIDWLIERGLERVTGIELPGEFTVHGGIVDVFPPDAVEPLRVEWFGDEIESIRRFDLETQRKTEGLSSVRLTIVRPVASERGNGHAGAGESLFDSLPEHARIALVEPDELRTEALHYRERLGDELRGLLSLESVLSRAFQFPSVTIAAIAADSLETMCHLQVESVERFQCARTEVLNELAGVLGGNERVLIACHNEGERDRLGELLQEQDSELAGKAQLCIGRVERGFRLVTERLVVISDHELFGRTELRRAGPGKRRVESRVIDSFLELSEGSLVVHLTHGIGRFRGMQLLDKNGQSEEHLAIEFRDGVKVYVPASLIHLVQKYVGPSKTAPELSKVGGLAWARRKNRVAEAVGDLAADMLRLQAAREARPGIACPPDSHWQREFEAAFPYTPTVDQDTAIAACREDLLRPRPMDRLICGDVGYGKTEVAMRACFKVVDAGRQVAVLVPTTVLAEQHYRTFSERMAEFPITIEVLSRFRTKAEQKQILDRMQQGAVDIVIGTHRLVQSDVRFKNLGLVVIDEEQRFGVAVKESLKQLRLEVDVLTLSATPIPRTLHMSLLGIRDISVLETPPLDRTAVVTRIARFDEALVRQAIIRELNRNGQIYFVHNRVHNIQSIAQRLGQIVPEASIGIAHGQMDPAELEDVMLEFVAGRYDVLVCTTIIESGLDIPNANTIFIHQADRYGLADLHQLRGRVGRYKHRAYCYLLLEEGRVVTPAAAKRLKAVEEFSELGAGFKIAMRDLEIRGAGNILGTQQSGHIAAVGYELYCQLLENAVRRLKGEPLRDQWHVTIDLPISAFLPADYVPPGRSKIEVYRKLSIANDARDLADLQAELRDRFGPLPLQATRLLELRELQILARHWRIDDIRLEEGYSALRYRDASKIRALAGLRKKRVRIGDTQTAYVVLERDEVDGEPLLAALKSVLQPN